METQLTKCTCLAALLGCIYRVHVPTCAKIHLLLIQHSVTRLVAIKVPNTPLLSTLPHGELAVATILARASMYATFLYEKILSYL